MPFIGRGQAAGKNTVLLDAITTSATATYNLTLGSVVFTPIAAQSLVVSLNGVTQAPIAGYTVSGSQIVFATALTSNDVIDYIIGFEAISKTVPNQGVTTAKIADDAVTAAKIADDAITAALIADDAVVAAAIADNAVDIARLNVSDGSNGQVLSTNGSGTLSFITSGGLYNTWLVKTTAYTALSGDQIITNHASTAFTITLPSGPSAGDTVIISNAGAATVTIARNSSNINSAAADGTLPQGNSVQLVYVDSTIGWFEV
tara:strand:- start:875 stop:1654 length:780 start_codon:yes stop_codon:yes gene_type:complete